MSRAAIAACMLLLSGLSWWVFPGHTWLQQDTQIYTPILEHLRDPSVLAKDIIVERPHVAFTIYDEVAIGLRKVTGLEFKYVLFAEQIVTRALGFWGVYLIATALGLTAAPALLVTLIWSLGATVGGPSVLTVEYEAVPRAFAVPLLMLAIGLAAHGRWMWSGAVTAIAALLHAPAVWPVLFIFALRKGSRRALIPTLVTVAGLLIAAKLQPGVTEAQSFFSILTPKLEMLQRMRAAYNWIGLWWREYLVQYLVLGGVCAAACWRLWRRIPEELRWFAVWLPVLGLLSMPVSWVLLDWGKWALIPQLQPMRALLFVIAFCSVLCSSTGCVAAKESRYSEAFGWFLLPWLLTIQTRLFNPLSGVQWAGLLSCAAASVLLCTRIRLVWLATASYWAIAAGVSLYPHLHHAELASLSEWARNGTPKDSVFLFADNGKANYPGIFRSEALRAVYVDWKGGGQVNYLREFADEWWYRWQAVLPVDYARYRNIGVNYVVLAPDKKTPVPQAYPRVFQNSKYAVYKLE